MRAQALYSRAPPARHLQRAAQDQAPHHLPLAPKSQDWFWEYVDGALRRHASTSAGDTAVSSADTAARFLAVSVSGAEDAGDVVASISQLRYDLRRCPRYETDDPNEVGVPRRCVEKCPGAGTMCLGGAGWNLCEDGHKPDSPLCAVCKQGWTQSADMTCSECPEVTAIIVENIGIVIAIVVAVVLLAFMKKRMRHCTDRLFYYKVNEVAR